MSNSAFAAAAMAALLVLAGCAGPAVTGTDAPGGESDGTVTPADGASAGGEGGIVEFYISDEENAIDDFEHLNVTVTKIGFHRVGDADDGADEEEATGTEAPDTEANGTPDGATPTATLTPTPAGEEEGNEEEGNEGEEEGDGEWVEYEVNATVDLTELQGANATSLGALAAPNGTYDKVFVYVGGIDATLENGESVNVKLPSNKLQINKRFTVGDGERVQFVFDLAVHKAGNSGKYILQPVISQSGTGDEVEIDDVDDEGDEREEGEEGEENEEDERDEDETEEPTETPEATETPEPTETPEDDGEDNGQGNNPLLGLLG